MEISTETASNVNHLFNTNLTPSPEQRNNLQNFILKIDEAISNSDKDISDINEQILTLQAKVTVIENSRAQLIQQRTKYSNLLSPLRCLPIEIFGKIFVYATQDCARDVLSLSTVCQLWRYAALGTPILWSTLELGLSWKTTRHLESWIERAQSYPLSLIIKKRPSDFFIALVDYVDYFYVTKHQWKSIDLDTADGHHSALRFFEQLLRTNLETLESLSLKLPDYPFNFEPRVSDMLRLGYMPKLTTLAISIKHYATIDMLPFPWGQLTSLSISFLGRPGLALDILQACVNLEEFTMSGTENSSETGPIRSIALNNLRKIHTHYSSNNDFLLSLKTPAIQDLTIQASEYKCLSGDHFYDYFASNGLTLLKLSIAPFTSRLVQSIPYLRSLVVLRLYDTDCDGDRSMKTYDVLDSIIVQPQMNPSTIPLPRLEVLEIICNAIEPIQRIFMKVVKSRWWSDDEENTRQTQEGHQSLSRTQYAALMHVRPEFNIFHRKDVDVLRAQGMKIEYLTPFDKNPRMGEDEFYTTGYHHPFTHLFAGR